MAKQCKVTGKQRNVANHVSHSNRKVKRVQNANLQQKRFFVPELGRYITLMVSTRTIKTISKNGLVATLRKQGRLKSILGKSI